VQPVRDYGKCRGFSSVLTGTPDRNELHPLSTRPALCSAIESSAFVKSVAAFTAPPLFKKRRSKVIVRVTRKCLYGFSDSLRTNLAPAEGYGLASKFRDI